MRTISFSASASPVVSASLRVMSVEPSAPYMVTFLDLSLGHCVSRRILEAVNIQPPHVDPLRLQLPAGVRPSALCPAACRICHQLLFPWMHSHVRHVRTPAVLFSAVCKQCWRTASLHQLRSLGGLLIPSLGTTALPARLWLAAPSHIQTPLHLIAQRGPRCVCVEDRSILGAPNVPCVSKNRAGVQLPAG